MTGFIPSGGMNEAIPEKIKSQGEIQLKPLSYVPCNQEAVDFANLMADTFRSHNLPKWTGAANLRG